MERLCVKAAIQPSVWPGTPPFEETCHAPSKGLEDAAATSEPHTQMYVQYMYM